MGHHGEPTFDSSVDRRLTATSDRLQKPILMDAIIGKLSTVSDWTKQPLGWAGAVAIAATDDTSAKKLTTFANRQLKDPKPRWIERSLQSIKTVGI